MAIHLYKSSPSETAHSYRPISVATGMYSIMARFLLDTLQEPINAALSDPQAGSRRGHHLAAGPPDVNAPAPIWG